ncbi:MAG: hypothetical protein GEV04_17650 [Actinophytocola sp.]|nr:hypothetical protein [Actinophytocola sp.]
MDRTRVVAASVIVLVMLVLQWTGWLGSAIEPVLLGMPIQFSYFLGYAALSMAALWGVFRLIWPHRHD